MPISLLIKPASGSCNLKCSYCFYCDVMEKRETKSYGMMSEQTLEMLVRRALEESGDFVSFAFQGGEPTLSGLDFYKRFVALVEQYNTKNIRVHFSIQTNGMVIDGDWARFLHKNEFLVGLSLDGDKLINDQYRKTPAGRGSFTTIMNTVRLFNKHEVDYNILCVVTNNVARHINRVYNFYKKSGFGFLQFIPCLDPLGEARGNSEYSLTPQKYEYFLKTLFDLWYADFKAGNYISIRQFDNFVRLAIGEPAENCGMNGSCSCYFVVEADGSVFPCDFYVLNEWRLGGIFENSFDEMQSCPTARSFVQESRHVSPECKQCRYYRLCRGGCKRDREPFADGKPALNYFCESYKAFFDHAAERIVEIANLYLMSNRQ